MWLLGMRQRDGMLQVLAHSIALIKSARLAQNKSVESVLILEPDMQEGIKQQ